MRKRRWLRLFFVILPASAIVLTVYFLISRGSFQHLSQAEAEAILNQALRENDASTYVAIQNEFFFPRILPEARRRPVLFHLKRFDFKSARTAYQKRNYITGLSRVQFWQNAITPEIRNRPVLYEAALLQIARNVRPLTEDRVSNLIVPDEKLMQLYSSLLLKGEALDRLWQVFLATGNYDALADYVIKSMESEPDLRGLDSLISNYLRFDPNHPLLLRASGLLAWSKGDFALAEPQLRSAAMQLSNDPFGRFAWAESRMALNLKFNPEQIMGEVDSGSVNHSLQEARRLYYMARLWEGQGKIPIAIQTLDRSLNFNAEDSQAWLLLGKLKRLNGDGSGADDAENQGQELSQKLNNLKKLHEAFRRGQKDALLLSQLKSIANEFQLAAVTTSWDIFQNATSTGFILRELKHRIGDRKPESDRFFQPRPQLISSRNPQNSWDWLNDQNERSDAENQIIFEKVASSISGIDYIYQSHENPHSLKIADVMGGGVAVFDFNLDGLPDLYFPGSCDFSDLGNNQKSNHSRLYENRGNFHFVDVTQKAGLSGHGYLMGVAVGDINRDQWPDLFVTGYGSTILYRNNGDGTFEDVTQMAGVKSRLWTTAAAFADLDHDGDDDLVAVTYVDAPAEGEETCLDNLNQKIHCSPGKFSAQTDILWENLGNGRFRDISESSGISAALNGRGLGLAVADFDDDGRPDLFVANDASPNFYFHNEGNLKFREIAAESGLAVDGSGRATASMGVVAADLDQDHQLDLFHTNFINEPNTFRKNLGNGLFVDSTFAAGLSASSLSRTGFGACAFDADLDGLADLFITNGHLDNQPHINTLMEQEPLFYRGHGQMPFEPLSKRAFSYLSRKTVGRGMASADFNNDGLVDLLIVNRDSEVTLLANRSVHSGQWIGLDLRSHDGGPAPVCTKVELYLNGAKFETRWVTAGTGYLSVNDPRMVFRAGPAASSNEMLKIYWPTKKNKEFEIQTIEISNLQKNRYLTVRQGQVDNELNSDKVKRR